MKLKFIASLAILAAFSSSVQAARRAPSKVAEFEPTSDWTLSVRPNTCIMTRTFQAGDRRVELQLESWIDSHSFRLTLVTSDLKARRRIPQFAFLPGKPQRRPASAYARLADGRSLVTIDASIMDGEDRRRKGDWSVPEASHSEYVARETQANRLFLTDVFDPDIVLETGSMRQPLISMAGCMGTIMRNAGIDPEAAEDVSSLAAPTDQDDWSAKIRALYPSKDIRTGGPAYLRLRLAIDKRGKVTDCFVLPDRQPEGLAERACAMARQQSFDPAHDAAGKPVASFFGFMSAWLGGPVY